MAKKITDKSKYKTSYKIDTWVAPSQYIAELVCESDAKTRGTVLPYEFWNHSDWSKVFRYQVTLAAKLLKKYSARQLIAAIKVTKNLTSLRSPILLRNIKPEEQTAPPLKTEKIDTTPISNEIRPNISKPNILDKLRDL